MLYCPGSYASSGGCVALASCVITGAQTLTFVKAVTNTEFSGVSISVIS